MKYAIFLFVCVFATALYAEDWTLQKGHLWSRSEGAATLTEETEDGKTIRRIEHTGKEDWALSEGRRISVTPGEIYELEARMKTRGEGNASISSVMRTEDGETTHWTYATRQLRGDTPWTELNSRFVVPPGVASIEPRVVGTGPSAIHLDGFSARKTGRFSFLSGDDAPPLRFQNETLAVDLETGSGLFRVTDKRTGRTWTPAVGIPSCAVVHAEAKPGGADLLIVRFETVRRYNISVELAGDRPELLVEIDGKGPMDAFLAYPPAFASRVGDRLVVPVNEGMGYPVDLPGDLRVGRLVAYGGHGICMAFWGQIDDASGCGMMGILETPDDASIDLRRNADGLLGVQPLWEPSMREFRYPRKLRYVFLDKGGHVAVCKRYREYAKDIGLFKPFTEKVERNPNIDILLGAVNVWCWDSGKVAMVREMKELGFDRILWSGGGSPEEITELNTIPNVLTSRYDIYQDIMSPEHFDKVHVHGDWTTEAWPQDINWADAEGTWRKGWYVDQKDKTQPRIPCAVICDAKALPYARKRISEELKTKPFKARFLDTTVAAPWFECYHPNHPMTRSDSRRHKMELLELVGELGLVCGSETGHDASVPYCDFFEGMLSLGPYRIDESGRDMLRIVDEVPSQIEQFQVNSAVRLPLWELVYHDCTVAQWYWGDYNNKLPEVWRRRDLFNALYGTPPMYMFTRGYWNENKDRFIESYRTAASTARLTAYAEMTDHRILSPDRLVQRTVFSNGVTVTVNFGATPYTTPEGTTLDGLSVLTIKP